MLTLDIIRLIVPRLSLWDARALQLAHPLFAELVHEHVQCVVRAAASEARPRMIDRFLNCRPTFQELVYDGFVFMKTPLDCTLQYAYGGFVVHCRSDHTTARIELRTVDPTCRPTFETLGRVVAALQWFHDALKARGIPVASVDARATRHRPVSEVLNGVVERFVKIMLG